MTELLRHRFLWGSGACSCDRWRLKEGAPGRDEMGRGGGDGHLEHVASVLRTMLKKEEEKHVEHGDEK